MIADQSRASPSPEILRALAAAVRDKRLSLESGAALVFIATDETAVALTASALAGALNASRDRTRRILNELIEAGYLQQEVRRERGRFIGGSHRLTGALGRAVAEAEGRQ